MSTVKISGLPSGTANASAVVPATNAAGTTTEKITLGAIAALGGGAPAAHKTSHATGGTDALSAADIGAAASSHSHAGGDITSGTVSTARLGSGTANSSTFLRGDGQWSIPHPAVVSLSYASTLATDASSGSIFDVTLTGNVTLSNPTNPTNGQTLRWRIAQDGTGGRTVTLGNKFALPASVPSLEFSTSANKVDILAATYHQASDKWHIVALVTGY